MIRTWADVKALEDLTPAEGRLIAACRAGRECVLDNGQLAAEGAPDPARAIRAELLRYLILGGCDDCPVEGRGVQLEGAHITGHLDLGFAKAKGLTAIIACRFSKPVSALQAQFEALVLTGSAFPKLSAQGAAVTGSVILRNVTATGEVRLAGATIGGQLDCEGATFTASKGDKALNAQGAKVTEGVFLRDVTATGEISLAGATIGGQLACDRATFTAAKGGNALNAQGVKVTGPVFLINVTATGEISLAGATIGGQLSCTGASFAAAKDDDALNAQRLRVTEGFFWRGVKVKTGLANFASAHVGDLNDAPESWPGAGRLYLDGFTYDRISGSFTDARRRIAWLDKCSTWNGKFFPQPYTQLAKVLREMGHEADARLVMARRESLIRRQTRRRRRITPNGDVGVGLLSIWYDLTRPVLFLSDIFLRFVVGYGHRPFFSLLWLLAIWAVAVGLSHQAWEAGDFAPNAAVIQTSPAWVELARSDHPNPAQAWSQRPPPEGGNTGYAAGQDWETFNCFAWAADLVIPIINLGQTDAWAPSTERGDWGRRLWRYGVMLQIAGWIVTALGAAAITGLIRRD